MSQPYLTRAIVLALGVVLTSSKASAANPPNFVVILCDDLGYGDVGCFGSKIKTPNLDRLAAQGARLTTCYSAAPVCSSSRVGLLTGRTPTRIGVYDWIPQNHVVHLRSSEITVATLLSNTGYNTCHVGKWHCNGKFNSPEQPQPGDHGFDHWFSTQNNAHPSHENPTNFVRNGMPVGPLRGYSCDLVANEAINWLKEKRDPKAQFFLFVCFHEPHEPIASPPDLVAMYPEAKKEGEALYYANVTNMDRAVGTLLKTLDDLQLTDETFVFFSSDNGPETLNRYKTGWRSHGSPGSLRGMKLHIYDGGIRVPGIARWPGHIKAGRQVDVPVCSLDLLPTFCELAGVKVPSDRKYDGVSLAPLFEDKPFKREKPLFWHYFLAISKPQVAMRDGAWKIVGHLDEMKGHGPNVNPQSQAALKRAKLVNFELYNIANDISESKDLATSEPERLAEMKRQLEERYADVIAEAPVWQFE
jgi:arylsulfatase A